MDNIKPSLKARKRSIGFSVWLLILIIWSICSALINFGTPFSTQYSSVSIWLVFIVGLLGVINFISLINVWHWKIAGFYGLIAIAFMGFVLNLLQNISFSLSIAWPFMILVLFLFMRSQWKWFE